MRKFLNVEVTNNGLFILREDNDVYAFASYKDLEKHLNTTLTSTASPSINKLPSSLNPWGIASTPGTVTAAGSSAPPTSKW